MQNRNAFLFDMDGTLVDNMAFHCRTWLELLEREGHPITEEQFYQEASGKTNREILRQYLGEHLTDADCAAYAKRKEELYREVYTPHLAPIAGLVPFLDKAKAAGIALALASSAGENNIRFVLQGLGLESYFEVTVRGDEVAKGKPDPEIFLTAAARLEVSPENCVVFEDAFAGIEGAGRAGMSVVALATTLTPEQMADIPHIVRIVTDYIDLEPGDLTPRPPSLMRSLRIAGKGEQEGIRSPPSLRCAANG